MMCEILFAVTLAVHPQSFESGGWKLDCQFMDQIGSPYLLAHGIGQPCVDAKATVEIPEAGRWRVRARTRNWEKSAPGKFAIKVNGKTLDKIFGADSDKWSWEDGGEVELPAGKAVIALHDLTGFDGRCAGVVLERDEPIRDIGPLSVERERPAEVVETDFTIVGGGMAGCCAAVAAARSGVRVALVQDRPVLGGNASGEIRVWCSGELRNDIVAELRGRYYNRDKSTWILDEHRRRVVEDEENVSLFLSHRAFAVTKAANGGVASVRALDISRNRVIEFKSPLFLDATGDGWVGYWAGADYRMGRESRDEFGETMAPEKADGDTLGASVMWTSSKCVDTYPFSAPWAEPWAQGVEKLQGEWNWEYGIRQDMFADAEQIRDRLFLAIYGAFSLAKRRVENSRYRIDFMPYLLGKRESRRLLGDWVFKESDVLNRVEFADAIAATSWPIDLHFDNCKPGVDYLTTCRQTHFGRAWVPFRSIYSRNIPNLMMAGRCFSCTHVGLGSPRVQNTLAQMGVAAGYAAAVCKREGILPRGVYEKGLVREIQRKMGGDWPGNPDPGKKDWLIVDDEDEGVVFGAGWRKERNENGGQVGQWTHIAVREDGADAAVYPLPVPKRGRYALMMNLPYDPWYPERDGDKESSRPIETAFELTSGDKTVRFRVCQAARIGGWSELGEYELEPGAKLKIVPKDSDLFRAPHADAFAVVPKNEFVSVWRADEPKGRQTHWTLPDAAFVGNGDLGLVNGDASGGKSFWICKGDFISGGHFFTKKKGDASEFEDPGMSATVGPFALKIEGVGTPEDTLSIATADLTSIFPRKDGGKVTVRTYVAKTANVIVSEIRGADGLTVEAGGKWTDIANWADGAFPQAGDAVTITTDNSQSVTLGLMPPDFASLSIGNTGSGTTKLRLSNWSTCVRANAVTVNDGGVICVENAFTDEQMSNRVWLAGQTLIVKAGGKILADQAGYAKRNGPAWVGATEICHQISNSMRIEFSGAYGGEQGYPTDDGRDWTLIPPHSYGSAEAPLDPGSGGGEYAGGGAIRLDFTGDVVIDGLVSAAGQTGTLNTGGPGSGGAVYINCRTISGSGEVKANERDAAMTDIVNNYGGAGGRVAVIYQNDAQDSVECSVRFEARGGIAYTFGGDAENGSRSAFIPDAFAEDGTLYFPDSRFLTGGCYRANGLKFAGKWMAPGIGATLDFGAAPLILDRTRLVFTNGVSVIAGGDVTMTGLGPRPAENGVLLTNGNFTVGGNLTLKDARMEIRGGDLTVAGNLVQEIDTALYTDNDYWARKTGGGELCFRPAPTNGTGEAFGAKLTVGGNWIMREGSATYPFTHPTDGAIVEMKAKNFTLDADAYVNADMRGYERGCGPGRNDPKTMEIGASQGGKGSWGQNNPNLAVRVAPPNGDEKRPITPGTGGWGDMSSRYGHTATPGGGVVCITATSDMTLNGYIGACGTSSAFFAYYTAGSSGGSIYLKALKLKDGTPQVIAQGGRGNKVGDGGGIGGGGRVAVWCNKFLPADEIAYKACFTAPRGTLGTGSVNTAEDGTVYWGNLPDTGSLIRIK